MKLCQIRELQRWICLPRGYHINYPSTYPGKSSLSVRARILFRYLGLISLCILFPPFALIGRVLQKVNQDQRLILIITPAWPGQLCFPGLLKMSMKNPLLLTPLKDLLKDTAGKLNTLVMQNSLRLVAWTISGRTYLHKEYQKGLPILSQTIGEHLQSKITSHLGRSSVVGALSRRYLP